MEYLPFRIAGRDFVVDASRVRAIVPYQGAEHDDVLLIDLRKRLSLPPVFYGRRPMLVILETGASEPGVVGFAADYVSDVIVGDPKDCRRGKLRGTGRSKWILDPDALSIAGIPSGTSL